MERNKLSEKEKAALSSWWKLPLRVKDGNIELKKGDCWGILCSIAEGKKNAAMIMKGEEKADDGRTN